VTFLSVARSPLSHLISSIFFLTLEFSGGISNTSSMDIFIVGFPLERTFLPVLSKSHLVWTKFSSFLVAHLVPYVGGALKMIIASSKHSVKAS
jgi:hypothetical protein